jgi:serine protease Do
LIGVNTAILAGNGGGNQGIGFAVPINLARFVMDQILKHGKVVRGYLGVGIQEVTPELAKAFNVPPGKGALVSDVSPDGPAAKAGLKKGDVIEELNGRPVTGSNDLKLQVASMAPGSVAHLKVSRNGQLLDIPVTLGELPEKSGKTTPGEAEADTPMKGVEVDELTPTIRSELGLRPDV